MLNGRSLIRGWHLFPFFTFTMILLGSSEPVSSVEECCKSTANFKTKQYLRQESGDDRDTDAGIPRKDEHAEGTKGCTRTKSRTGQWCKWWNEKPSYRLPCQKRNCKIFYWTSWQVSNFHRKGITRLTFWAFVLRLSKKNNLTLITFFDIKISTLHTVAR